MILDDVDLSLSLSKTAFKYAYRQQRQRLYDLGTMAFEAGLPTMVVFEGWDAAGKGTTIRYLTRRLDPRGFQVHSIQAARTHEKKMPWLWRFWMKIPAHGQIAIFDRSWYGRVTIERVEGLTPIPDWIRAYEEINEFERTLVDDGTLIVKFWLHISRKEQLRRFVTLAQDKDRAWQVTEEDWERHRKYDEYRAALKDMLANTDTAHAPWVVVPSTDMNYRVYAVMREIVTRMEQALDLEPTAWLPLADLEEQAAIAKAEKKRRKKERKAAKKARKEAAAAAQAAAEVESAPAPMEVVEAPAGDPAAEEEE